MSDKRNNDDQFDKYRTIEIHPKELFQIISLINSLEYHKSPIVQFMLITGLRLEELRNLQ